MSIPLSKHRLSSANVWAMPDGVQLSRLYNGNYVNNSDYTFTPAEARAVAAELITMAGELDNYLSYRADQERLGKEPLRMFEWREAGRPILSFEDFKAS